LYKKIFPKEYTFQPRFCSSHVGSITQHPFSVFVGLLRLTQPTYFSRANPAFDPEKLYKVAFVFDKTHKGMVVLDDIGFRTNTLKQDTL
jgi:hypothetical protein